MGEDIVKRKEKRQEEALGEELKERNWLKTKAKLLARAQATSKPTTTGTTPVNPLRAAQWALEEERRAGCIPPATPAERITLPGTDMGRVPMIDEMDRNTDILNGTLPEEPGHTLNLSGGSLTLDKDTFYTNIPGGTTKRTGSAPKPAGRGITPHSSVSVGKQPRPEHRQCYEEMMAACTLCGPEAAGRRPEEGCPS